MDSPYACACNSCPPLKGCLSMGRTDCGWVKVYPQQTHFAPRFKIGQHFDLQPWSNRVGSILPWVQYFKCIPRIAGASARLWVRWHHLCRTPTHIRKRASAFHPINVQDCRPWVGISEVADVRAFDFWIDFRCCRRCCIKLYSGWFVTNTHGMQ